jgi:hypothetical protein
MINKFDKPLKTISTKTFKKSFKDQNKQHNTREKNNNYFF